MAAMLPGAAAGVLGAIGIGGSSTLARTLSPIAEPLFVASAVLVIVGALACGRLVALISVAGSFLLYLSMFQLASGGVNSVGGSMSMMTMQPTHHGSPHAEPVSFYLGLAFLVAAFALSIRRRRRRECRPLLRLPQPLTARHRGIEIR
jgi:MYXO-CTERM domain-containing protein